MKTGFSVLAGAVALALSHGAVAQTQALSAGTIFVDVEDLSTHASFVFDTGIATTTGPTSGYSQDLTALTGYTTFAAGLGASDAVQYVVEGGSASSDFLNNVIDITSNFAPATNGLAVGQANATIATFLGAINNPSGGSTSIPAGASVTTKYSEGGYEAGVDGNLGLSNDGAALGTALHMYQIVTTDESQTGLGEGETSTLLSGTWNIVNGILSYNNPVSAVPLPAPVLLLVSGLGLMGVVARRRKAA